MTEMDFDELDKAVNSLMSGVKASSKDNDEPTTLTISSTLNADEKPEYDKLEKVAQKIGNETIDASTIDDADVTVVEVPVSPVRSGRFMDVMHPSSDMRSSSVAPGLAARVERPSYAPPESSPAPTVGPLQDIASTTTLLPDEQSVTSERKSVESNSPEPIVQPLLSDHIADAPVNTQGVATEESPILINSVEPLAAVENSASPASISAATTELQPSMTEEVVELQSVNEPSLVEPVGDTQVEPQTSPFIADAKVEKRPLGGSNGFAQVESDTRFDSESSDASSDQQHNAPSPDVRPDEYHGDLLAIETGSSLLNSVATSEPPTANTTQIYNVDAMQAPINHPAKKSSGWLWIILTILIITVCGGGAAAYYLLTM